MASYVTTSCEETELLGKALMSTLPTTAFVALFGDLGAGKTAFVRGMVRSFLPSEIVTSPTYNIVNSYTDGAVTLYHYDMYRITDDDDLFSVGFYDNLDGAIVVAEWCENIPFALPETYVRVTIRKDPDDDSKRYIDMEQVC